MSDRLDYRTIEFENEDGFRFWTKPIHYSDVSIVIDDFKRRGYGVSDIDYVTEEYYQEYLAEEASWDDDDHLTDAEADAMTLASAGWGTEEDYGYFDGDIDYPDYGE